MIAQTMLVSNQATAEGKSLGGSGRQVMACSLGNGGAGLIVNIALNVVLIPRYKIAGAAWASSISYSLILIARLVFYCRLSSNSWIKAVFPQRGDWALHW